MIFTIYCSGDQIQMNEMVVHVSRMAKGTYKVLMWKSDGRRPLGGPRRGCKDNIEMDFSRNVLIWLRIGTDSGLLFMW